MPPAIRWLSAWFIGEAGKFGQNEIPPASRNLVGLAGIGLQIGVESSFRNGFFVVGNRDRKLLPV